MKFKCLSLGVAYDNAILIRNAPFLLLPSDGKTLAACCINIYCGFNDASDKFQLSLIW
jgi:hypothetical protein